MPSFYYNKDFDTSVSLGLYDNVDKIGYLGFNDNLPQDIEQTLSPLGQGILTTPSDSGELLQIRSDDPADIGITVICTVLDQDGYQKTTVSTLNGTTPVPLIETSTGVEIPVRRINEVYNYSTPALNTVGTVFVEQAGGGTIFSGFTPYSQYSANLLFTIPVDKRGIFLPSEATINKASGSDTSCIISTKVRVLGRPWWVRGRWGLQQKGSSAFLFFTADQPAISPLTDIMITAISSANGLDVSGRVAIQLNNANIGA